jgi:hypothetical protein
MMDYIRELGSTIAVALEERAKKERTKVTRGVVSGKQIKIDERYLAPIWGGDFDVAEGDVADCIVEQNRCVVLRTN